MPARKIPVILIGSGGHARVVVDILELGNQYEIIGLTTNDLGEKTFCDYPVLGTDDVLPQMLAKGIRHVAIGVGGFTDNRLRKKIFLKMKAAGFDVVIAIHPTAVVSRSAKIGQGSTLFARVVINPDVTIGENVIVATGSTVDHETLVADHVLISAGVTVGAYDRIEEEALLAIGSTVVSGKVIGKRALVAAGAVVVSDVAPDTVVAGIPAREWKTRNTQD